MELTFSSYKSPDTINQIIVSEEKNNVLFRLFQSGMGIDNSFIEAISYPVEEIPKFIGFLEAIYKKHLETIRPKVEISGRGGINELD